MKADNLYPFVERDAELAWLFGHLREAQAGHGRVCFLAGEPGAGKTALIAEFARRAQASDQALVVGIGECNAQTGSGDPYLPFREMLRLLTGDTDADLTHPAATEENATRLKRFLKISGEALVESGPDLVGLFIPGGSLLARLGAKLVEQKPGMAKVHALLAGKASGQVAVPGAEALRQDQVFEQYANVVRSMAAACPLILVLDDLHWADEASLGLLFHLGRRIEQSRVLVIGSYRPNDVALGRRGDRHPLAPVLNELQRHYGDSVLDIGQSDEAMRRRLVDAMIDVQPNRLDEGFRRALLGRTQGHPLFVVELLRHMQASGGVVQAADGAWEAGEHLRWEGVPARVEGVVAERIDRLPEDLRTLLNVACVEGDEFTAEVVAAVAGQDERATARRLGGELDKQHQLIGAEGVMRVGGRRVSVYRFRHQLFHAYLYDALDEVERSYRHEDVGRALEGLHASDTAGIAVRLARHFEAAGDLDRALGYRLQAGQRAQQQYANTEARMHFQRVIELAGAAGSAGEDATTLVRAAREGIADVTTILGSPEAARAAYAKLLDSAEGLPLRVQARLHRKLGDSWMAQHRVEEALASYAAAEACLPAADLLEDPEDALEWLQLQVQRMFPWYLEARDLAPLEAQVSPVMARFGTAALRARFYQHLALGRLRAARYVVSEEILSLAQSGDAAAREAGQAGVMAAAGGVLGVCHLDRLETEAAEHYLREACRQARRAGSRLHLVAPLTWLAVLQRLLGRVEAAAEDSAEALALARELDNGTYIGLAEMNLAWVAWRQERLAEAREAATAALARAAPLLPFRWIGEWPLLGVALREQRGDDAIAHVRVLLGPGQQQLPASVAEPLQEALQLAENGRDAEALSQLEKLVPVARQAGYL